MNNQYHCPVCDICHTYKSNAVPLGDGLYCQECYTKADPVHKLKAIALPMGLTTIANVVLDDARFPVWSGSSKPHQHHYGKGGLAQHTFEVVDLCLKNNAFFNTCAEGVQNKAVPFHQLFLAALFHDAGKMWDYEPTNADQTEWQGSSHKRHIHHISRSGIVWSKAWDAHPMTTVNSDEWHDAVLHAILAHHQLREWGSPVSPNTRLAWLLHLCDGISARMDDGERWDRHKDGK